MKIKDILNKEIPDVVAYTILGLLFFMIYELIGFELTLIFMLVIIIVKCFDIKPKKKQEDEE